MVEFRGEMETAVSQFFATHDGILSFDVDWHRDRLYWANQTGHVQCTGLMQVQPEHLTIPVAGLSPLLLKYLTKKNYVQVELYRRT